MRPGASDVVNLLDPWPGRPRRGRRALVAAYQAWSAPQWGQSTEVVTSALNAKPQPHR